MSEYFDLFVGKSATAKEVAGMALDDLVRQVRKLRVKEGESFEKAPSDLDIAAAILEYAVEESLYEKETGHTTAITIFPGGQKSGLDYGPVVVEVVVLDHDGDKIAYRVSTDAQDENWAIGSIGDAVETAAGEWDAVFDPMEPE